MKIHSAEFVKSAFERSHWTPGGLPEIAFLGRSNVGKSSLINSLLGRKDLARTSNTPGRTQSINFYTVNGAISFADLPGYGYARVSRSVRESWGTLAEEYLSYREDLVLCVQLFDLRHQPTSLDLQLSEWLAAENVPRLVVGTKADKISNNELAKNSRNAAKAFGIERISPYSSVTGRWKEDLWKEIETFLPSRQISMKR